MSRASATFRRASPATLLLVAAVAISAGGLIWLQSHLTFFLDEWDLLLHRRGFDADAFLRPHNEHIIVVPAIVYKALQATVGMGSAVPYQLISIATFVASAILLFVWVRRRAGEWPALLAAISILFLGAAWEDLLSAFQIGYFASITFGLAALLLLERPSLRNDVLACLALVVACASSSVGLPMAVGGAIAIATGPRARARAWVVAIPIVLFALWWVGWGSKVDTQLSFETVAQTPPYVLAGLANGLAALVGLAPATGVDSGGLDWGRPLVLVAGGVLVWVIASGRGGSRWLWVPAGALLTFWALAGLNAALFRAPTSPRYVYIGAVFMLMIGAELIRGRRVPRWGLVSAFAVVGIAIAANSIALRDGYRSFKSLSENERAGLTALELARDTVEPDFLLTPENSDAPYFDYVDAESYLSAVDAFGSPALSLDELLGSADNVRIAADKAVAAAERLTLEPAAAAAAANCVDIEAGAPPLSLGPGAITMRAAPGADIEVGAQRFSSGAYPVELGRLRGGELVMLSIPADRAPTPWAIALGGHGAVRACRS